MGKQQRYTGQKGPDGFKYRRTTARLRREQHVCWLCGEAIDPALGGSCDDRCTGDEHKCWKHPRAWTADHVVPRARGGHVDGEIRAAHRDCNSRRGTKTEAEVMPLPTTRVW